MTSARSRRIDEIGEESRRRILDAAEELFAEKGFDRTSFVDIAERSGISRGSIPWHFTNKDGLLMAVVERGIDRYIPQDSLSSYDLQGLRDVIELVKQWIKDPVGGMMFMVVTEAMSTDGPVRDQYLEFLRDRRKGIANLLAATSGLDIRTAEGRAALEASSAVLNGALLGLGFQYRVDPDMDLDAAFEALLAMVERLTPAAQPEAPRRSRAGAARRRR